MNRSLVSTLLDNGRRGFGAGFTMKHVEEELVRMSSHFGLNSSSLCLKPKKANM